MSMNLKEKTRSVVTGSVERNAKFQDYVEFVRESVDGSYIYTGPIFSYGKENSLSWKRYRAVLWICSLLICSVSVASGTLYIAGMNTPWQIAPLGLEIIIGYMTAWSAIRLTFTKQPMKIFDYRPTVGALPGRALITMFFALAGLVSMTIYVFMHGFEGKAGATLLYMLARIFMALTAALLNKTANMNDWDETETSENL